MKIGTLLLITHDVVEKLVGMGLLTAEGDFTNPDIKQDLAIIAMVESCVKARGVHVQEDVDKIMFLLNLASTLKF